MIETLEALLAPVAEAEGCELYDIEYVKEGGDRILRLFIDREEGIGIDDCERVSRAVELILDEVNLINTEYRLQVSSPGVERKLKKPAHYARFVGHKIEVRLYAPHDPETGRKKFTGKLTKYENDCITINAIEDGENPAYFTFDLQHVSACKLVVFS